MRSTYETKIIVIDNVSQDATVSHIRDAYPFVRLIVADKNLGFGQGNNIGLEIAIKAKADYLFLLNQDAWVEATTIEKLVNEHASNVSFGIISPVHLNGTGNDFDDHFYEYFLKSSLKEIMWTALREPVVSGRLVETPFVNAACWLISAACVKQVGGFDPVFFHYGEDDNYGQRVLYKGFKMGIHPGSFIYHDKYRPAKTAIITHEKMLYKEWTQFLVYACDIHRKGYRQFITRRACSSLMTGFISLLGFNFKKTRLKFMFSLKILLSFSSVKRSRKASASELPYIHLKHLQHNI